MHTPNTVFKHNVNTYWFVSSAYAKYCFVLNSYAKYYFVLNSYAKYRFLLNSDFKYCSDLHLYAK